MKKSLSCHNISWSYREIHSPKFINPIPTSNILHIAKLETENGKLFDDFSGFSSNKGERVFRILRACSCDQKELSDLFAPNYSDILLHCIKFSVPYI